MRAVFPPADTILLAAHIEASLKIDEVRALLPSFGQTNAETAQAIVEEASKFADDILAPLNNSMDKNGVSVVNGRVVTSAEHQAAWSAFVEGGWPTLDHPVEYGGQQLPLSVGQVVQELFDRQCPSFGMLPVPQRSAARLIAAFGDAQQKSEWLGGLADGSIGATICISETGAGSDVMQLQTRARQDAAGNWRVTGEKCWISFGDHDLTQRLVHCVLARTDGADDDRPVIGLFLVEGGGAQPDKVMLRRTEEKLGLHGSPTCALGFEEAPATLLGEIGRGLQQMFVMITQMRIATGVMGLGIAGGCTDISLNYAEERKQGGRPGAPVAISEHKDVQRMLLDMVSRTELLRGLILNAANLADLSSFGDDADQRKQDGALVQWLLPIVKTMGADVALANASTAIQIFGGAGYTREWPVEQALRDARILAIFEGTSGIQALDLVHRRVLRDPAGMRDFIARARATNAGEGLHKCLDLLEDAAARFAEMDKTSGDVESGASAFLSLAILAASGWVAGRFMQLQGGGPAYDRMKVAAKWCLDHIADRAQHLHAEAIMGAGRLNDFQKVRGG